MSQREYDEKDWGLEIDRCDDGDILLRQGDCCGCGDDVVVRLHPCHFPLMAEYLGLMTREEFDNATAKANDRLHILAGLIAAHLPAEHPLVKSAALMAGRGSKPSLMVEHLVPVAKETQLTLAGLG